MTTHILSWTEATHGTPDSIRLIGPFATDAAAVEWVDANNPYEDPFWQLVELSSVGTHTIAIEAPEYAKPIEDLEAPEPEPNILDLVWKGGEALLRDSE